MRKPVATSLIMATVLSLGIPYHALADVLTQTKETETKETTQYGGTEKTETTQTTQYSSQKTESSTVNPSLQGGMSNLMLGNQFGYTNDQIVVGSSDGVSPMLLPKITIGSANTSILVLNPTPKPVTMTIPQLNMSSVIPPNGARIIQIDKVQTASLTPGQEVAYYINDSDGNQIASSNFINQQEIVSMIDINTQVAYTEETRTTTISKPPTERKSTVRGYW